MNQFNRECKHFFAKNVYRFFRIEYFFCSEYGYMHDRVLLLKFYVDIEVSEEEWVNPEIH